MLVNFAGLITSLSSPGLVSLSICCLICFSLHLLFSCCFFGAEEVSQICVTFTGRESKASRCLTTNQSEKEVINIDESSLNHFGVLLTSHSISCGECRALFAGSHLFAPFGYHGVARKKRNKWPKSNWEFQIDLRPPNKRYMHTRRKVSCTIIHVRGSQTTHGSFFISHERYIYINRRRWRKTNKHKREPQMDLPLDSVDKRRSCMVTE